MEARIIFIDKKLKESFDFLRESDEELYKKISKALDYIKNNIWVGRQVKKKLIPRILIDKYEITNLWIYNLSKDWRLLYSLGKDEIEVLAVVLDWMNHKDYERLFNF